MTLTQDEIDAMLKAMPEQSSQSEQEKVVVSEPTFSELDNTTGSESAQQNAQGLNPKLDLLYDLQLVLSIELGRTTMMIRDILRLTRGSVVEFDKLVSEPVDVLVNGRKIAEGEVVVIDKHFGIRITSLVDPSDRLRSLRR
ncbi:MAG: flagellar motor switch protein FliN [Chlorobi bacterium]|nr:flagellar motor switch protein FliN [Chlorobiota bacterium]